MEAVSVGMHPDLLRAAHTNKATRAVQALAKRCDALVDAASPNLYSNQVIMDVAFAHQAMYAHACSSVWRDVCLPFVTEAGEDVAITANLQDFNNLRSFAFLVNVPPHCELFATEFRTLVSQEFGNIMEKNHVLLETLRILVGADPNG